MNRLFFICPECFIENTIRENFDGEHFFLTSLGLVVDKPSPDYANVLNKMCERENIEEICLIQDSQCTFIKESIRAKHAYKCSENIFLHELFQDNLHRFSSKMDIHTIRETLAMVNIEHQMGVLADAPVLADKIRSGEISLKGFVLNSHTNELKEISEEQVALKA
ncbi:hypothetical protein AB9P05_19935 [Roseivirga sp. BDSF3-8]|uniref:hypothetical protein n=1 Tax=Roseivirga sp. BDSF3-8 TaxID=3241598 RepID=UPI003532603C